MDRDVRITQQAKAETRERILDAAQELFRSKGFDQTTTRDISREAGIASGTLFNYFPCKEAIVMTQVAEALTRANEDFEKRSGDVRSLEEDLFAHVAAGLRRMRPYRKTAQPALETGLSPLVKSGANQQGETIRVHHLETVQQLLAQHGLSEAPSAVAMQLYWTLYTGVLAFWANDSSPKQEDTLALLDQSLRMFVSWLGNETPKPP